MRSICAFSWLFLLLALPAAHAGDAPAAASLKTGFSITGDLAPGEIRDRVLRLDEPGRTRVLMLDRRGGLDFALVSPSGKRLPARADSVPAGGFGAGPYLDMNARVLVLESPEVGAWTVRVSRAALDAGAEREPEPFVVTVWFDRTEVEFTALEIPRVVRGAPGLLRARLTLAGAALAGAAVVASFDRVEGERESVTLHDDGRAPDEIAGDGTYSASVATTALAGRYPVSFVAEHRGTGKHAAFTRDARAVAVVSATRTRLSGGFRDRAIDSDGDGLFDHLDVEVGLDVTDAARYRLVGTLRDAAGHEQLAEAAGALEAGRQGLILRFDGAALRSLGTERLTIGALRLFEDEDTPLDGDDRFHAIGPYELARFGSREPAPRD